MRYFLKIAYDGTGFHGWQRQPNANSIQQTIEDALSVILRKETEITGAGRTDAGVHAKEMFAHFDSDLIKDKTRVLSSLNNMVGNAIAISDLFPVNERAHARFDAIKRSYQYFISLKKNPFLFCYSYRMKSSPDIDLMNEAAQILLETEDFTSFAKLHTDVKTNICKVTHARWNLDKSGENLIFEISADRFLRNMVRAIVGTLLEVGTGKLSVEEFKTIVTVKDRCAAGMSAPAKGLFLSEVAYPEWVFKS